MWVSSFFNTDVNFSSRFSIDPSTVAHTVLKISLSLDFTSSLTFGCRVHLKSSELVGRLLFTYVNSRECYLVMEKTN